VIVVGRVARVPRPGDDGLLQREDGGDGTGDIPAPERFVEGALLHGHGLREPGLRPRRPGVVARRGRRSAAARGGDISRLGDLAARPRAQGVGGSVEVVDADA